MLPCILQSLDWSSSCVLMPFPLADLRKLTLLVESRKLRLPPLKTQNSECRNAESLWLIRLSAPLLSSQLPPSWRRRMHSTSTRTTQTFENALVAASSGSMALRCTLALQVLSIYHGQGSHNNPKKPTWPSEIALLWSVAKGSYGRSSRQPRSSNKKPKSFYSARTAHHLRHVRSRGDCSLREFQSLGVLNILSWGDSSKQGRHWYHAQSGLRRAESMCLPLF